MRFHFKVHAIDDSAEAFHGRVLGIDDMVDFYGRDFDELRSEFHASDDAYLEWRREEGQ